MIIVTDPDGLPEGIADPDQILADATIYAYAMAVHSDDPDELTRIAAETLTRVGVDGFGYVCAAALRMTVEHILEPVLQVTDKLGVDLRAGLDVAYENARTTLTTKEN